MPSNDITMGCKRLYGIYFLVWNLFPCKKPCWPIFNTYCVVSELFLCLSLGNNLVTSFIAGGHCEDHEDEKTHHQRSAAN